jgi:hypothetical protein
LAGTDWRAAGLAAGFLRGLAGFLEEALLNLKPYVVSAPRLMSCRG